jgi:DNA-directed RNA polymerase specialized sigma24 family protein
MRVPLRDIVREERVLTEFAFGRLLEWLDDGVDSGGGTYLEIRRRLVTYFDRRNRPSPDELADETFNRIARTLEESAAILVKPPVRYCYVVARFVLLEDLRCRDHGHLPIDGPRGVEPAARVGPARGTAEAEELATREERLACLERCLEELKPEQRELIVEYYRDTGRDKIDRRRALATRLGITMNALGIRACRIRDTLEAGVETCCRER